MNNIFTTTDTELFMEVLFGPPQHDAHMRAWRWHEMMVQADPGYPSKIAARQDLEARRRDRAGRAVPSVSTSVAIRVAELAYEAEKRNAKALGHDGLDVAMLSFGDFCETLLLAYSNERPVVEPRFRRMG